MLDALHWLGHSTFHFDGTPFGLPVIYTDPFGLSNRDIPLPPADIILITHSHRDHLSPESLTRITKESSIIVAPLGCEQADPTHTVRPGDKLELSGITIEALPAYNINKAFHPKDSGFVGYMIKLPTLSIYHAGDTDRIPEMRGFTPDVALLPIGGTYTMTAEEAAGAAEDMGNPIVIPMHYGSIIGTADDAKRLAELGAGKFTVRILSPTA